MTENLHSHDDFIGGLPKAELHLHIEGSLEPEIMFLLAKRNRVGLPFESIEAVRAAYDFSNLQDFLDIYYRGAGVLLNEEGPPQYIYEALYILDVHRIDHGNRSMEDTCSN